MEEYPQAVEARPWRPEDGPAPTVHVYQMSDRPMMGIRVGGRWETAVVRARYDHADGRVAYQVEITVEHDGARTATIRSYWWDPTAMRPLPTTIDYPGALERP